MSRLVVDKYVYLSKAGTSTVEVWDRRSERTVDCIDCAQILRYGLRLGEYERSEVALALYISCFSSDTTVELEAGTASRTAPLSRPRPGPE